MERKVHANHRDGHHKYTSTASPPTSWLPQSVEVEEEELELPGQQWLSSGNDTTSTTASTPSLLDSRAAYRTYVAARNLSAEDRMSLLSALYSQLQMHTDEAARLLRSDVAAAIAVLASSKAQQLKWLDEAIAIQPVSTTNQRLVALALHARRQFIDPTDLASFDARVAPLLEEYKSALPAAAQALCATVHLAEAYRHRNPELVPANVRSSASPAVPNGYLHYLEVCALSSLDSASELGGIRLALAALPAEHARSASVLRVQLATLLHGTRSDMLTLANPAPWPVRKLLKADVYSRDAIRERNEALWRKAERCFNQCRSGDSSLAIMTSLTFSVRLARWAECTSCCTSLFRSSICETLERDAKRWSSSRIASAPLLLPGYRLHLEIVASELAEFFKRQEDAMPPALVSAGGPFGDVRQLLPAVCSHNARVFQSGFSFSLRLRAQHANGVSVPPRANVARIMSPTLKAVRLLARTLPLPPPVAAAARITGV